MDANAFSQVLARLAPLEYAEDWDNVGVLLAPARPSPISAVLLTIDFTRSVLEEAVAAGVEAVISYHPPIFSGLKRLVPGDRVAGIVLDALAAGLLVYSPHTALDAVEGGVNDWLCEAFPSGTVRAILPHAAAPTPGPPVGQGRLLTLDEPLTLEACLSSIKEHLKLSHVRLARSQTPRPIQKVAVCAGAGGSVLMNVEADLLLTGEMRHHDVLQRAGTGTSVVLTEHTNSERGYLPRLAARLVDRAPELRVVIAKSDRDPLEIV